MKIESIIRTRARQLASSHKFKGWRSIETALRAEGYKKARTSLDDDFFRKELNALCQNAEPS